jgi:hypothetical protein
VNACARGRDIEYRIDLIEAFSKDRVARQYVKLANRLGRLPLPEEFPHYSKLTEVFGSPQRIERLTLSHIDQTSFEGSRAQRREDILTYLATLRLQAITPPPLEALPVNVRGDIKGIWPSYKHALLEAHEFLFSLGNPNVVRSMVWPGLAGRKTTSGERFNPRA